jgi:hypothetical protein
MEERAISGRRESVGIRGDSEDWWTFVLLAVILITAAVYLKLRL